MIRLAVVALVALVGCDQGPGPSCELADGEYRLMMTEKSGNCGPLADVPFAVPQEPGSGCVTATDRQTCARTDACLLPITGGRMRLDASGTVTSSGGSGTVQITVEDLDGRPACSGTYAYEIAPAL